MEAALDKPLRLLPEEHERRFYDICPAGSSE